MSLIFVLVVYLVAACILFVLLYHCFRRGVGSAFKFVLVMAGMTTVCTIVWEREVRDLYDCTDDVDIAGYWMPGDWVHGWGHGPVVSVPVVTHNHSMSDPDTIKEGWGVPGLLCLWFSFFAASVFVSFRLARLPWIPQRI